MFSFVFQSHISLDCDEGIPPSDAKVIPPSDVKVIPPSDVKVLPPSDVKVLCGLLCVTVKELCDCPKYTPVTVLTLCDCPSDWLV